MFSKIYTEMEVNNMSPLVWAYIGDSVWEIYIRDMMISSGIPNNAKLHKATTRYVKASSQSRILEMMHDILTNDEKEIVRRGRNANSNTIPKNADIMEYKNATSFEGILGYLFLQGKYDRAIELMKYGYEHFE